MEYKLSNKTEKRGMVKQRKAAQKRVSRIIDYKEFFTTPKGQKILYDLCNHSRLFTTVTDETLLFAEGQRDVIRYILAQTKQDPAKLMQLYEDRLKEDQDELHDD